MERVSVPFSFNNFDPTGGGLTQQSVEGLVRLDAEHLVVEFRERVTDWSGMGKGGLGPVQTVRIPLDDVESLELSGWLFWHRLVLRTHSLGALGDITWANGAQIAFGIPFRARGRARELCASTTLHLLDRTLRRLDAGDHRFLEGAHDDDTAP